MKKIFSHIHLHLSNLLWFNIYNKFCLTWYSQVDLVEYISGWFCRCTIIVWHSKPNRQHSRLYSVKCTLIMQIFTWMNPVTRIQGFANSSGKEVIPFDTWNTFLYYMYCSYYTCFTISVLQNITLLGPCPSHGAQ